MAAKPRARPGVVAAVVLPVALAVTITTFGSIRLIQIGWRLPMTVALVCRLPAVAVGKEFNFRSRRFITSPSTTRFLTTSMATNRTGHRIEDRAAPAAVVVVVVSVAAFRAARGSELLAARVVGPP